MTNRIAGPGQPLPPPQYLYPTELAQNPNDFASNAISLAAGQAIIVPAGDWILTTGGYSFYQELDPVTGIWRGFTVFRNQPQRIYSDGVNFRVANLTGCPVAAIVTTAGSGYVQSSTTVVPSAGNSTWLPIIGGGINKTVSILTVGAGYTIPPLVLVPAPPNPGVAASMVAAISSGTVSSITVINQGAGYQTLPNITLVPNPADPAFTSITNATAKGTLTTTGALNAVLCTNPGQPIAGATAPTLTIAGAGSSAVATCVMCSALTSVSITSGGTGYNANNFVTSYGGIPTATATYANPAVELTGPFTRPFNGVATQSSGTITSISTIYDNGMFFGTPTLIVVNGLAATTIGTFGLTQGGITDTIRLQPV